MYRLYGGELLARCRPHLGDPAAYVACTNEEPVAWPKSVAVRGLPFLPVTGVAPILSRYRAATVADR